MAEIKVDPLKYVEKLPEFNGKPDELHSFLRIVEDIVPLMLTFSAESQKILLNRIKSKLTGKAREAIEINSKASSWDEIKDVLVRNFGERKTATHLFDELRSINFETNAVDFYAAIKRSLRRLNNKYFGDANAKVACDANTNSALQIFVNKIPEPMRSILYAAVIQVPLRRQWISYTKATMLITTQ